MSSLVKIGPLSASLNQTCLHQNPYVAGPLSENADNLMSNIWWIQKHFSTYKFSSVQCHFTWIYYWQHNIRHKTWEKFPLENNLPKMAILILKIFQSFLGECRKFKNIFFKCIFYYICTFYHLVAHLLTDIQFVKINIKENINIYDGIALKQ